MSAETTIQLQLDDGIKISPVEMTKMREALDRERDRVKGRPRMKPDTEFDGAADAAYGIAAGELRAFVERIERLEAEKKDIAEQVKEVFAEAKGRGYDTKALRLIVALRKVDRDQLAEFEAVVEMYRAALGF